MSAPTKNNPTAKTPKPGGPPAPMTGAERARAAVAARQRARTPTAARRYAGAVKARFSDWLDRPMTSLHLLLAVFFLLLAYGLLMVLSSSSIKSFKTEGSSFGVFKSQLLFAGLGLVGFYACMRIKLSWLRGVSTTGMIIALGLLVVVLGAPRVNGARSWINVGAFTVQPSEIAKFAMVIWGAHVLAARRSNLGSWRELLIPVLPIALLMGGLIMLEPDMGTTAALMIIVFGLFFFAGASWWLFSILASCGIGALVLYAFTTPYALKRLVSFANPEANAQGSGMQLLQGLYGMADGGLFGVGLGHSSAKWQYLPHAESDFIFAIVGEELGLIGAGLLVALYVTLALVGLRIARRNMDPFVKLVAATSTAWLVGQAAINIFYVIGLLPVTGIPLPMISAGGTSLIVTMAIFGLLANFARREPKAMALLQEKGPGRLSRFFGIGIPGTAIEEAKALAGKAAKQQNREWARTSARKAAQEKKEKKAAARGQVIASTRREQRGDRRPVPPPRSRFGGLDFDQDNRGAPAGGGRGSGIRARSTPIRSTPTRSTPTRTRPATSARSRDESPRNRDGSPRTRGQRQETRRQFRDDQDYR
ncbi:putative lipid II flippase FtsW [Nakamurella antarctica]|uniref:putative lipid II flippase FtsW n=1 Tax=Nakamurella antarctica TaxID=1902245 RepID=UPI0013DDF623|nr:putative lipid II flippase FtsW [Nakamurella antarctica]